MNIKQRSLISVYVLFICLSAAAYSGNPTKTLWSVSYFGEEDFFYRSSDIEVDRLQSLIYIADSGNNRIAVFDFEGKFIKAIGRKGQGPGEFTNPAGLCVFKDSQLAVADYNNRRIQLFDKYGDFIRAIDTKEVRVADLIFMDDKFYTIPSFGTTGYSLNMSSKENTQPIVVILDDQGNRIKDITVDNFPESHPFVRAIKHRVCIALSPEGKLYLPYFAMNLIQVFDLDGNKLAEFERLLPFKPITPRLKQQRSPEKGVIQMSASLDMVSKAAQFGPDHYLYILSHKESFHERLKRAKKPEILQPPMQIEVIDPNSYKIVRYIPTEPGVQAFALIDKNRLVYIHEDSEGELTLKCIQF